MDVTIEDSRFGAAETYYEHLVFMIYFPDDFREALQRNAPRDREASPETALDLLAWGTVFVYQARMQPFRFRAVQSRYQAPDGRFRKPHDRPGTPRSNPMFKLQLTMQLALEIVMRRANLESLFDEYPTRAQLLVDTLYYVAELQGQEKAREYEFQITPKILREYLLLRAANDRGRGLDQEFPGQDELNRLFLQLGQYLQLLSKPELIKQETLDYVRQWSDGPNKRLWSRLARSVLPDAKPVVERLLINEDELAFRFHLSRSGLSADDENPDKDPLKIAPAFNEALGSWDGLLTTLFGDATAGHGALVGARLLDENPGWGPVEDAYLLTRHLVDEPAGTPSRSVVDTPGSGDGARAMRLAALQMQDYVAMLDNWRRAIALGLLNAGIAAAAAAQGVEGHPGRDSELCQLIAVRALGAVCHFDPLAEPAAVANDLSERFHWPRGLDGVLKNHLELGSHPPFSGDPQELTSYCGQLADAAARIPNDVTERSKPDWSAIWRDFWVKWSFGEQTGTVAPIEQSPRTEISGTEVLHAARHGGIPVIPPGGGSLSVGQWWRILALYAFSDEPVPPNAAAAATMALGFREEIEEFRRPHSSVELVPRLTPNLPILSISVSSAASPALTWRPNSRAIVVMPPPLELGLADNSAIRDPATVTIAFERLQERLMLGPTPSRIRRWLARLVRLFGIRRSDFVRCEEIRPDFAVPNVVPEGVVYFGFGPAPPGLTHYVESPTSVSDLLDSVRKLGRLQRDDVVPTTAPAEAPVSADRGPAQI